MKNTFNKSTAAVLMFFTGLAGISLFSITKASPPATAPTTAPSEVFMGGKTITPDMPAGVPTVEAPPTLQAPISGPSGGSGTKAGDIKIGEGIGPSRGDQQRIHPNASVPPTTAPSTMNSAPMK